ncbi:putative acyl-CoA oxidase [Trypanosoma theileri]|uniref:Putative acyl-CoA oxidase n=1 Tax=Trypanosoma theileri TaxID=67003 RepID=A0A1X0NR05_9TRYP|nr:putative acyl-CoA oxidase [Trypanosoma theileri]ORC87142.1 putative acyl-CoA oxidase [Trypanosoma theileri]
MTFGVILHSVSRSIVRRFPHSNVIFTSYGTAIVRGLRCRQFHRSLPLQIELNPSKPLYSMEHAFEEPTFRFICEGLDIDYKEEVRAALLEVMAPRPSCFVYRSDESWVKDNTSNHTVQLLRSLAKKRLLSFAQVKSTPQLFSAFFETVAMCNTALALVAADHFTFAAMIAIHGTKEIQEKVLDGIDNCSIIGSIAHRELIAEGVPLNTEARYDQKENCFILRGTGKFAVVSATGADWVIVTATLTLNKQDNHGPQVFVVNLREKGILRKGVSIRPIQGEHPTMSASGVGVIHFDNIHLPVTSMLLPSQIVNGKFSTIGDVNTLTSIQALTLQMRLATSAIYAGTLKKLLTNVVHFIAQKYIVGPDGQRNYPFFGVQHVQTPLVKILVKSYVYLTNWRRILPSFTNLKMKQPKYEDEMILAGTIHFLQESLLELHWFADSFMGVHASLGSTGNSESIAVVHLRQEGVDQSSLIREVAFRSVTKNIGTSHWGWWLSNILEPFNSVDRFVKNPFYSPRVADLGRHLMFFSHKHYRAKKQLRQSREIERRKGGSEHQWYDWVMFRHQEVLHCGEAYMEMHSMEIMMDETQACTDPRGRKILRDIGWIFALARQQDRLDYILAHQMITPGKSFILGSHIDNLVTVLAPQCVNLVDAFQVPEEFRAPCAANDMEPYWTIPGTNTGIQRGDKVIPRQEKKSAGESKTEQEKMQESDEDFDLFHGLADEPSFAQKR